MSSAIFVERFKELLACAGKNENGLAQDANLTLKSVHNWSRGITYPSPQSLLILAGYFKVSTDYLLGLDNYDEEKICKETRPE
jgi:transcriptional regulator with XRE-family HTH domain